MKLPTVCCVIFLLLIGAAASVAQVSNLTVNGSTTAFTMASGDAVTWSYDLPAGATATITFWLDLNGNAAIDPGTDKIYGQFDQTDGLSVGMNGPPDMDGSVNGQIFFSQPVGLAPSKYVLHVTQNGSSQEIHGEVTPILSPNASISGVVTPPSGQSAKNIVVEASWRKDSTGNEGGDIFWDALTDSLGAYTIELHVDTTTTYWQVRVSDDFSPNVSNPEYHMVTLHTTLTNIDFTYEAAAAKVQGFVYDPSHNPMPGVGVSVQSDTGNSWRYVRTDGSGRYQIGFLAGDLDGRQWHVSTTNDGPGNGPYLQFRRSLGSVTLGDSLTHDLTLYPTDATIRGVVRYDGHAPGYRMNVYANVGDSLNAYTDSDSASGEFTLHVSSLFASYMLNAWPFPMNAVTSPVSAAPGDTGVVIEALANGVVDRGTGVPEAFALRQNYPNPFNPTTSIDYDLPTASLVRLSVYDMLGREVARLMDDQQPAGSYTAHFDASAFPSGVYFCRLAAGGRVATQKMLLMK